jgi:branched-subunit amino acid ABC-type transport system permease component
MKAILPFLLVGVTTGSLYGLAGLGLVLTYRSSGVFNFAHGAVAAAGAYVFYELHILRSMPWFLALVIAVGLFGIVAGWLLERLARLLTGGPAAATVVATVGLLLAVQGGLYVQGGVATREFPRFLPDGTAFTASGVQISWDELITVTLAAAVALALYGFLRFSRMGLAMRAAVDDSELVALTGQHPARIRLLAWTIGACVASLSGILIAPIIGLDAGLLTLLVVQAFGAVALGRFVSLPLTFLGGIAVGVLASLATKYLGSTPPLNGIPASMPFLVLFVALLTLRPATMTAARTTAAAVTRPPSLRPPPVVSRLVWLGAAAVLVGIPWLAGPRLSVYSTALTFVVILLSLSLLVRLSGQISLCHAGFAAVGATTFSHLATTHGLPWVVALLGAGLITAPIGGVLAIPAVRLSGIYLALATFGFGILVQSVGFSTWLMFGDRLTLAAPRPVMGSLSAQGDRSFYFVLLAVVAACCAAVLIIERSRLGRLLRALSESPTALVTHGLPVNLTRLVAFSLSAFFAGVGGALVIAQQGLINRDYGFGPFQSLTWLAVLVIAGTGAVLPSFIGAGLLVVVPSYITGVTTEWQMLLFGVAAIVAACHTARPDRWHRFGLRLEAASRNRSARSPVRQRTSEAAVW